MARAFLLFEALEIENRENQRRHSRVTARLRRRLRNQAEALALSDTDFKANYRLTKKLFKHLCSELKPFMVRLKRRTKISVECKVLTALSFYATGSYQKPVGMSYLHGLSQASVSNAVKEVTRALNTQYTDQVHTFPSFSTRKTGNNKWICDSDLNILNIDASFGGASHDAYMWKNGEIQSHLQELHSRGENVWFLGDSGYPLRPWLLTPILWVLMQNNSSWPVGDYKETE
ncbi:unnamed protein product, partial [Brenthis ino]